MVIQARLQPIQPAELLVPGHNCWRIAAATRLAFLIDAQSYFSAFFSTLLKARHSVVILAWDIDTRVPLIPGEFDGLTLGDALQEALDRNPHLQIYILCWDFAMIYSFERQVFQRFRRSFRHPRVQFILDSTHPFGACHHQKIVIADEQVAFVGGLDICTRRWDTRGHLPRDMRRKDAAGKPYAPFHDLQVVLEGPVIKDFVELARDRWFRAAGKELPPFTSVFSPRRGIGSCWPDRVLEHMAHVPVAISRTMPTWNLGVQQFRRGVIEIEQLYLDSIRAARRHVYIENQYFTSEKVAEALIERCQDPNCPEFLFILPRYNSGWLEESTMGVLRTRLIERLRKSDRYNRLRFYYPVAKGVEDIPISLHSKIMIIDGNVVHTGSSNLSNRSMGLDTECDIALVADGDKIMPLQIAELRDSLLAEHLGTSDTVVRELMKAHDSLFCTVDRLQGMPDAPRTLMPFVAKLGQLVDYVTPGSSILDPDRPVEEDTFFSHFVPEDRSGFLDVRYERLQQRLWFGAFMGIALMAPPLREVLKPEQFLAQGSAIAAAYSWLILSGVYFLLGSALRLPIDILVFFVGLFIDARLAWAYCLAGISLASLVLYAAGTLRRRVRREAFQNSLGGFWSIVLLHLSLLASLPIISFRAGKLGSPWVRVLAGTAVGSLPRVVAIMIYVYFFKNWIMHAGIISMICTLSAAFGILTAFRWASRRFLPTYVKRF